MNTRKTRLIYITMLVARSALYLHVRKVTRFCFEKEAQITSFCLQFYRLYSKTFNPLNSDNQYNSPFTVLLFRMLDGFYFKQKHNNEVYFLNKNGFEIVTQCAVVKEASNSYVRLFSLTNPLFLMGSLSRRYSRAFK